MTDNYSEWNNVLDLQEGVFVHDRPPHPHLLEEKEAKVTSDILKVMQPGELDQIKLNHDFRRNLLYAYEKYYALHIQDFGSVRSLPVLSEILK